uniref:Uncharacterized protein n=1 Tax=Ascaris lumbricoides TaxID=6252 RepID=A0A0M3HL03_ASCLU
MLGPEQRDNRPVAADESSVIGIVDSKVVAVGSTPVDKETVRRWIRNATRQFRELTTADSGQRAATQWTTSNNRDVGLIFLTVITFFFLFFSLFFFVYIVSSRTFGNKLLYGQKY